MLGQPFAYPEGQPQVTATIVTLMPGQETGWHRHEVPLLGYILEGALTVDYGPAGSRAYEAGDAFLEAFGSDHDGRNAGDAPGASSPSTWAPRAYTNTVVRGD